MTKPYREKLIIWSQNKFPLVQKLCWGGKTWSPEFNYREKFRGPGVSRGMQPRELEGRVLVHAWERQRKYTYI
jgi:hypothetical protein